MLASVLSITRSRHTQLQQARSQHSTMVTRAVSTLAQRPLRHRTQRRRKIQICPRQQQATQQPQQTSCQCVASLPR